VHNVDTVVNKQYCTYSTAHYSRTMWEICYQIHRQNRSLIASIISLFTVHRSYAFYMNHSGQYITDAVNRNCALKEIDTYFSIGNDTTLTRLEVQNAITEDSVRLKLIHRERVQFVCVISNVHVLGNTNDDNVHYIVVFY